MCCDGVIQCLEKEKVPILIKDRHTCLDLNDSNMYVLKKGIVEVSLIMQDEREFNITYLQGPDVVSLYCDCLTQFRDCLPKIRIESEQAELYCFSKEEFYKQVKEDANLQNYVNTYYRNRLKLAITREQVMIMNSKAGAVCSWLYRLASLFGIQTHKGIFIDLQVTNEDIANFNNILYNNLPSETGWIETNSYLLESGYSTQDGVHFDAETYQKIFNYTMEVLSGFGRQ